MSIVCVYQDRLKKLLDELSSGGLECGCCPAYNTKFCSQFNNDCTDSLLKYLMDNNGVHFKDGEILESLKILEKR